MPADEGPPPFEGGAAEDEDDDAPAPETGLHALGQLAIAVVMVAALLAAFLAVALVWNWLFR